MTGQQQQGETVTTPLASVQEEKEDTEWPQSDEQKAQHENGMLYLFIFCVSNVFNIKLMFHQRFLL